MASSSRLRRKACAERAQQQGKKNNQEGQPETAGMEGCTPLSKGLGWQRAHRSVHRVGKTQNANKKKKPEMTKKGSVWHGGKGNKTDPRHLDGDARSRAYLRSRAPCTVDPLSDASESESTAADVTNGGRATGNAPVGRSHKPKNREQEEKKPFAQMKTNGIRGPSEMTRGMDGEGSKRACVCVRARVLFGTVRVPFRRHQR